MAGRLDGRIAVVTGAASGLGRAAAVRLAAEGAQIGIIDLQTAEDAVERIRSAGGTAESWRADTTEMSQIESAIAGIGERFGRIDILVNDAGILQKRTAWDEVPLEEVERFININDLGYYRTTRAAYDLLKKSEHGRIINVASRTYFMANAGQMAYVASKGAVMGMTRVLARELGAENITVNGVMPGMVATEGLMEFNEDSAVDRVMQNQSIKRRVEPEDLAALIAFLASDDASMITGQMILCDGGGYLH